MLLLHSLDNALADCGKSLCTRLPNKVLPGVRGVRNVDYIGLEKKDSWQIVPVQAVSEMDEVGDTIRSTEIADGERAPVSRRPIPLPGGNSSEARSAN